MWFYLPKLAVVGAYAIIEMVILSVLRYDADQCTPSLPAVKR